MTDDHRKFKLECHTPYDASAIAIPDRTGLYLHAMDGSQQVSAMNPQWLKAELEKGARSQSDLARFMKVAPETVNRICAGKRGIKAHEADQIRAYLAGTQIEGATNAHLSNERSTTSELIVRGTVEAGSWRQVPDAYELEFETLPAPKQLVDSGAFALRVSGPSMNDHYADGSYVVVQPWYGGPMPVGKHVVVERERPDGLVETTIKELSRRADGELELIPRSNHPAHKAPVPYSGDDVIVRLVGRVIWAITPVP